MCVNKFENGEPGFLDHIIDLSERSQDESLTAAERAAAEAELLGIQREVQDEVRRGR